MMDQNSTTTLLMKNGTPYQLGLCVEPGTRHTVEFLKEQIGDALCRMSTRSRWQRFASPVTRLSEEQLDYLADLDGKEKVAWCASISTDEGEQGIALVRYIKLPDEPGVAEFAITVVDDYQGQGIGLALMRKLIETARQNGLETLKGYVMASNRPMLSLCKRLEASFSSESQGCVEVTISLSRHTS